MTGRLQEFRHSLFPHPPGGEYIYVIRIYGDRQGEQNMTAGLH